MPTNHSSKIIRLLINYSLCKIIMNHFHSSNNFLFLKNLFIKLYHFIIIPFTYLGNKKVHVPFFERHIDFLSQFFSLIFINLPFPFSFLMVSGTFNNPFGFLFNFRSHYLFSIGIKNIFRF